MDFTGVALGSGVNQYMRMDEMARQNKKLEMDKALNDQQVQRGQYELNQLRELDNLRNEYADINSSIARGDYLQNENARKWLGLYDNNDGPFNDGYRSQIVANPNGGQVMNFVDADGKVGRSVDLTPQNVRQLAADAYRQRMQFVSPQMFMENQKLDQENRKISTDERYKLNVIPGINTEDRLSRERIAQMQLGPQYARLNFEQSRAKFGNPQTMYDADGNPAIGVPVQNPDGTIRWAMSSAPQGYAFTPKTSGAKAPVNPEDVKEYRKAMTELGPRPVPVSGLMGGVKNQKAIDQWDAAAMNIRQIYGVDGPASTTPQVVSRGNEDPIAAARQAARGLQVPQR